MQSAMAPAAAQQILDAMIAGNGAVKRVGEAWLADVVQGYRRCRVPVEFQKKNEDLLIVYDGDGKVAGLFHVPHAGPSPEGVVMERPKEIEQRPRPDAEGHWEGSLEIRHPSGTDIRFAIRDVPGNPTFEGAIIASLVAAESDDVADAGGARNRTFRRRGS